MTEQTSPNQPRFRVDDSQIELVSGLKLFSLQNSNGSYVIPSTKNFIDNFQIKKLKTDDGATCTVLPISNLEMLADMFGRYTVSPYIISVTQLRSVGGITLALTVSSGNDPLLNLRIGLDVFPLINNLAVNLNAAFGDVSEGSGSTVCCEEKSDSEPISSANCVNFTPTINAKNVNFFLCTEDINFILNDSRPEWIAWRSMLARTGSLELLQNFSREIPRRNSGLLGNDFLEAISGAGIHVDCVRFFFDVLVHDLSKCSWRNLLEVVLLIKNRKYLSRDSVDFHVLDSIEPNDIVGLLEDYALSNDREYEYV